MPVNFPTDVECIERMMPTVGKHNLDDVTIGRIRNTLELGLVELSENLLPVIAGRKEIEVLTEPKPMDLDADGNFRSKLFPSHDSETVSAH